MICMQINRVLALSIRRSEHLLALEDDQEDKSGELRLRQPITILVNLQARSKIVDNGI